MNIIGDMKKEIPLVAFMIFTILSLGLSSNTAFAGDVVVPPPPCQVHAEWFAPFSETPQIPSGPFSTTDCPDASGFTNTFDAELDCFNPLGARNGLDPLQCHVVLPNWIDDFDTKIIFIDIFYDGAPFPFPLTLDVTPSDDDPSAFCETIVAEPSQEDTNVFIYDIECHPNPDSEEIFFTLPPFTTSVAFWTQSFDAQVGGMPIPIDSTALILAGAQSISMWMIPVVIAGIGIAVFVIKRKN